MMSREVQPRALFGLAFIEASVREQVDRENGRTESEVVAAAIAAAEAGAEVPFLALDLDDLSDRLALASARRRVQLEREHVNETASQILALWARGRWRLPRSRPA